MKPKHLKYLREVAERVLDKYEETMYEDPDGTCSRGFARHEALQEIDAYLENLSIKGPRKRRG